MRVVGSLEKAQYRSDHSLHDFLVCAQVEAKEWNEKKSEKVHTYKPHYQKNGRRSVSRNKPTQNKKRKK